MTASPPSAATSLLVPVYLDAWVVDSSFQTPLALYAADYAKLEQFASPFPPPYAAKGGGEAKTANLGIHLHWALPDALTRGRPPSSGGEIDFPHVPNRWLVVRVGLDAGGKSQCKLWVVQSDFLDTQIGTTAAALSGTGVSQISLAAGASEPIAANTVLRVGAPGDAHGVTVRTVAPAVAVGGQAIAIAPCASPPALPAGPAVTVPGTSPFLDPRQPSAMQINLGKTASPVINQIGIGRTHAIDAWEARTDAQDGLFLQAVGPGNVSFAAHVHSIRDVFSFNDADLPAEDKDHKLAFTYMVVGWYSDSAAGDPLRGISTYLPDVWKTLPDWQKQSRADRFKTLLATHKWSVKGDVGDSPPIPRACH